MSNQEQLLRSNFALLIELVRVFATLAPPNGDFGEKKNSAVSASGEIDSNQTHYVCSWTQQVTHSIDDDSIFKRAARQAADEVEKCKTLARVYRCIGLMCTT